MPSTEPLPEKPENKDIQEVLDALERIKRRRRTVANNPDPTALKQGYITCSTCKWLVINKVGQSLCGMNYRPVDRGMFDRTHCGGKWWQPRSLNQTSAKEVFQT